MEKDLTILALTSTAVMQIEQDILKALPKTYVPMNHKSYLKVLANVSAKVFDNLNTIYKPYIVFNVNYYFYKSYNEHTKPKGRFVDGGRGFES